jgi:hypothetical protein
MSNALTELGVIVSWIPPKQDTTLAALWAAMRVANLDPALVKEMSPSVAFNRAIKEMDDKRIIRRVEVDGDNVRFQFTKEHLAGGELQYTKECDVNLDTTTGNVTCDDWRIQDAAQKLVDNHRAVRDPADITRLIQKIFDKDGGDLIPVRQQGGCYFVPASNTHLLGGIRVLLTEIHGVLNEWEVSGKSEATRTTVAANISDYMFELIDEFKAKCESVNEKTKESVLERRYQEIAVLSAKLEANQALMTDFAAIIRHELTEAQESFERAAVGELATV